MVRSSGSSPPRSSCRCWSNGWIATPPRREASRPAPGSISTTASQLCDLARGIHPAVLTERGLEAAVVALVQRAPVPVDLAIELPKRVHAGIEAAAYFVISEALTNVAKYARAETVSVDVRSAGGSLLVTSADDGIGRAELDRGSGLRGLVDRVHAVGGTLDLSSPPGNGTRLSVQLPTKVLGSLNSH